MPKKPSLYLNNLVRDYRLKHAEGGETADIITFAESKWGLGFSLFPMQKFILKAFYGLPLDDTERYIPVRDIFNTKTLATYTEREMMDYMIENHRTNLNEYVPGTHRRNKFLCCGRRASKTNIISIVASYEAHRMVKLGNPQEYYRFPSGQEIAITVVAKSDDQAATLFGMIKTRISESPFFRGRIDKDTGTCLALFTDEDMRLNRAGTVRIYCGGAGSALLRSKNNLIVIMDEAAHFDPVGKTSLQEVAKALEPSTLSFVHDGHGEGQVIMLSSPLSKNGAFYERVMKTFDNQDEIMFKAYTALINLNVSSDDLKKKYREDRESFRCEYEGEFSDTIEGWCDPSALEKAMDGERSWNRLRGEKGTSYFMGVDYGAKNDGTAIAICHNEGDKVVLDYADVYYASQSDVWESPVSYYREVNRLFAEEDAVPISKIADEIKSLCDRYNIVDGWYDQANGYGLQDFLKERDITQLRMVQVNQSLNIKVFQTAKSLLNSGLLILFNHPVLIPELGSLEERKSGATIKIEAPQRRGYHDDISDAFVRAVYSAYTSRGKVGDNTTIGFSNSAAQGGASSYRMFQMQRFRQFGGEYARISRYI